MIGMARGAPSTMLSAWRAVAIGVLGLAVVALGENVLGGSTLGGSSPAQQGRAHAEQPPLQLQASPLRSLIIGGERTGGRRYPFLVHWDVLAEKAASDFIRASGHGVMITDDVFVTLRRFRFEDTPKVVTVGDYDRLNNGTESIQTRTVVAVASQPGTGSLLSLYKIHPPVTLPGFVPVRLNEDPQLPNSGQPVVAVGYGRNDTSGSSDPDTQSEWPGEASQIELEAMDNDDCFDAILNYNWDGPTDGVNVTTLLGGKFCTAVPTNEADLGEGDMGGPVLDKNNTLLGLVDSPVYYPKQHVRISSHLAWIHDTTCRMSDSKTLSFCDDIACPIDAVLYGLPRAKLVDGTDLVKTHNQFKPDDIVQDPEPGTRLKAGNKTNVTIRATNSVTNETRSCVWKVTVPPLTRLGVVEFSVDPPCGPYQENGVFAPEAPSTTEARALSGQVRKIRGSVFRNVSGIPAIRATITDANGSDLNLSLQSNETRAFLTNVSIPFSLTSNGESSLAVKLLVRNDTICTRREPFVVRFVLLGQANETIPTLF